MKRCGEKNDKFHLCHCYQTLETAGWHVVHLSLKAPGQKWVEEQVADPDV